ncbi:MAG: cell division protein FtsL [Brachymonas sp.]|jgi:cell division protein FtsL
MMSRFVRINFVLLPLVLLSAFHLVNTQYQARHTFMDLDKATQRSRALDVEREVLEVEKREAASNTNIEQLARTQLGMRSSPAGSVRYVRIPATATAPAPLGGRP